MRSILTRRIVSHDRPNAESSKFHFTLKHYTSSAKGRQGHMSMHLYSFRQGNRSEYLAQYMLSALGLAVKVTIQEDVGIDFYCNVGKRAGNTLTYVAPYNAQVKSRSDKDLLYGGSTAAGTWRQHSLDWILTQQTPLFAAVVDKRTGIMDLFSTANRWFALYRWPRPYQIVLRPYELNENGEIGGGTPKPLGVAAPPGVDPVSLELPLGEPVVSMDLDAAENDDFVETARGVLSHYINLDARNTLAALNGLQIVHWPLVTQKNAVRPEQGIWAQWSPAPTPHTHAQLRAITPIVASLLWSYEHATDWGMVGRFKDIVDLLPKDDDLAFLRTACGDIVSKYKQHVSEDGGSPAS
jgi:hypothetical protein